MEITHRVENEILVFSISERLDAATAPIEDFHMFDSGRSCANDDKSSAL